jgi:hypothetical protein
MTSTLERREVAGLVAYAQARGGELGLSEEDLPRLIAKAR